MEHINFKVEDKIGTLTFNRPEVLNALNWELINEFDSVLDELKNPTDVRTLILTGAGDRAFVSGADITGFAELTPLTAKQLTEKGQKVLSKLEQLPIPVIAAVNGYALGGGLEIALACDFIYASQNAVFGLPEIKLGIIPGYGGTQRLGKLIGTNLAKEMIYTGKQISAKEAWQYKIVNRVCQPDTLMPETIKTAATLVEMGAVSLRAAKEAITHSRNTDIETGCRFEASSFAVCVASRDAAEGPSAFLEKRKTNFTGRFDR